MEFDESSNSKRPRELALHEGTVGFTAVKGRYAKNIQELLSKLKLWNTKIHRLAKRLQKFRNLEQWIEPMDQETYEEFWKGEYANIVKELVDSGKVSYEYEARESAQKMLRKFLEVEYGSVDTARAQIAQKIKDITKVIETYKITLDNLLNRARELVAPGRTDTGFKSELEREIRRSERMGLSPKGTGWDFTRQFQEYKDEQLEPMESEIETCLRCGKLKI